MFGVALEVLLLLDPVDDRQLLINDGEHGEKSEDEDDGFKLGGWDDPRLVEIVHHTSTYADQRKNNDEEFESLHW